MTITVYTFFSSAYISYFTYFCLILCCIR